MKIGVTTLLLVITKLASLPRMSFRNPFTAVNLSLADAAWLTLWFVLGSTFESAVEVSFVGMFL